MSPTDTLKTAREAESERPSQSERDSGRRGQLRRALSGLDFAQQVQALKPPDVSAPVAENVQMTTGSGGSGSTGAGAGGHPSQADLDHDISQLEPVADLVGYKQKIESLKVLPTPSSKASVTLRVDKLIEAIPKAKRALQDAYGAAGSDYIKDYIDDRLKLIETHLTDRYIEAAQAAWEKISDRGELKTEDQFDATAAMKYWPAIEQEEFVSNYVVDKARGVMKVFDAFSVWDKMKESHRAAWDAETSGNGKQTFVQACVAANQLALAPPGKESKRPFKDATVASVFEGAVFGFVGLGRDAEGVSSFSQAITVFALNEGWYPSGVMFLSVVDAGQVQALLPDLKLGKPSIFYLLVFDENTYEAKDRVFGHLADPDDPTKPGESLELQVSGMPDSLMMANTRILT